MHTVYPGETIKIGSESIKIVGGLLPQHNSSNLKVPVKIGKNNIQLVEVMVDRQIKHLLAQQLSTPQLIQECCVVAPITINEGKLSLKCEAYELEVYSKFFVERKMYPIITSDMGRGGFTNVDCLVIKTTGIDKLAITLDRMEMFFQYIHSATEQWLPADLDDVHANYQSCVTFLQAILNTTREKNFEVGHLIALKEAAKSVMVSNAIDEAMNLLRSEYETMFPHQIDEYLL